MTSCSNCNIETGLFSFSFNGSSLCGKCSANIRHKAYAKPDFKLWKLALIPRPQHRAYADYLNTKGYVFLRGDLK